MKTLFVSILLLSSLVSCNYSELDFKKEGPATVAPELPPSPLQAWSTDPSTMFLPKDEHSVLFSNDYVYVMGGGPLGGSCGTSDVYYAPRLPGGGIGSFTATSSLVVSRHRHTSVLANNHVYVIGGNACGGPQSSVQRAQINPDGSLGAWVEQFNLPVGRRRHTSIISKGQVYVIGGSNPGFDTVYRAPLIADGTLGAWVLDSQPIPVPTYHHASVLHNDYLYVIGGTAYDGAASTTSKTHYVKINSDGSLGEWMTAESELPIPLTQLEAAVLNGRVYVIGGISADGVSDKVYSAALKADGSLGKWFEEDEVLPLPRAAGKGLMVDNILYYFGGLSVSGDSNTRADTIFKTTM